MSRERVTDQTFTLSVLYLWIVSQYDLVLDLKIKVGHCDLYFVVQ